MKKAILLGLGGFLAVFGLAGLSVEQTGPPEFAGGNWQSLGPAGGNVIAFAANPQNANEIFAAAGTSKTHVYKSTDGGATWSKISTISATVFDLAFNQANPDILYTLANYSVYKSTDRGATWTAKDLPANSYGSNGRLAVNRADANTIYASGYRYEANSYYMTVYKSANGGDSWTTQTLSPAASYGYTLGLAVFPTNANIVYASGYYYAGSTAYKVYKTTNGGNSWQDISGSIYGTPTSVVVDPNNSNRVFVGTYGKVFYTSTGGPPWSENVGVVYASDLALDPVNTNIVFAAGEKTVLQLTVGAAYKSTDGGLNWQSYTSGLNGGTGKRMFIGTAGSGSPFTFGTAGWILYGSGAGVFRSTNGGTNWQDVSSGINANNVTAIGIALSAPNKLYVECSDNGFYKTDTSGASWQRCTDFERCDAIKRILVNPSNPNDLYILAGG